MYFLEGSVPSWDAKQGMVGFELHAVANAAGKTSCGSPRVQDLRSSRPEPIRTCFGYSIRLAVIGTILTLPNTRKVLFENFAPSKKYMNQLY